MPTVFQWASYATPLRYFLEIVRALFLKGAGLPELWSQLLALLLIGLATMSLAIRRFERSIA